MAYVYLVQFSVCILHPYNPYLQTTVQSTTMLLPWGTPFSTLKLAVESIIARYLTQTQYLHPNACGQPTLSIFDWCSSRNDFETKYMHCVPSPSAWARLAEDCWCLQTASLAAKVALDVHIECWGDCTKTRVIARPARALIHTAWNDGGVRAAASFQGLVCKRRLHPQIWPARTGIRIEKPWAP